MFKKCKRGMTVLLAAVMLLTTMLPLTASAASGVTMDLTDCHVSWDYTLTDEEGNTFSAATPALAHRRFISAQICVRLKGRPLLVRKIAPKAILFFPANFKSRRQRRAGRRIARSFPFSAMSARPRTAAYTLI